jgi:hypothetical protein
MLLLLSPTLRIVGKKICFALGHRVGIGHSPTAPTRWPHGTATTPAFITLPSPELPEEFGRCPDGPEGFFLQAACDQADPPAGHHRPIARNSDA